jgi:hypothetical protein
MKRLAPLLSLALLATACTIIPRGEAPQDLFWDRLQALCGRAFPGRVVTTEAGDSQLAAARLVLHVATCTPDEVRIAFHAGEDASRVWVIARSPAGFSLTHIHRGQDGREEVRSHYGGETVSPGTIRRQEFPADTRTRALFRREDIAEASANIWSIDILPGQLFGYAIDRPGRHLHIEFDLARPIRPPGPAWGER